MTYIPLLLIHGLTLIRSLCLTHNLQDYSLLHPTHQPPLLTYLPLLLQISLPWLRTLPLHHDPPLLLRPWPLVTWALPTNPKITLTFLFPFSTQQYHLFQKITPLFYQILIENLPWSMNLMFQLKIIYGIWFHNLETVCGFSKIKRNVTIVLRITNFVL